MSANLAAEAVPSDTSTYLLTDLLRERAAAEPDVDAFRFSAGEGHLECLTFTAWDQAADASARGLLHRGLQRADRVALVFGQQEWIAYTVAYTAVLRAGGVAVHLPAADAATTRQRILVSGCSGVIFGDHAPDDDVAPPHAWQAAARDLAQAGLPLPRVELGAQDPADILWTSGTTGPAKAFLNAHGTLMYGRGPSGLARLDITRAIVAPMPMGTASSAMTAAFMPLVAQEPVLLCDPGDLETIGALTERFHASTLMVTPWTATRLARCGIEQRYDLSEVTTLALASAALPARTARDWQRIVPGLSIRTFYAQGEAVPAVLLGTFDAAFPLRLGRPGPESQVRIMAADGSPAATGEVGEIVMRHPAPRRRHLDPERDTEVYRDGWTHTADLGSQDDDGFVHLFDRRSDVIHTVAGPVSSQAVEQVLYDHEQVVEVAVTASGPAPQSVPQAWVVLAAGADPDAACAGLRDLAEQRLAPHEVPGHWQLVDALPRGLTGKVLKYRLQGEHP